MMKERTLRVLEFTKIRERLASFALTDMGKEKCLALVPCVDFSDTVHSLDETEEANVLISYLGGHPLMSFPDVREHVKLAQQAISLTTSAGRILAVEDLPEEDCRALYRLLQKHLEQALGK